MDKNFLVGVLVGMALMFATLTVVETYRDLNTRLGFVEGYIQQLDQAIRGAQGLQMQVAPSRDLMRASS